MCSSDLGWRLSETRAADLAADIATALDDDGSGTLVILWIFDNAAYVAVDEAGRPSLPHKEEGRYHVKGALKVVDDERAKELLFESLQIVRACKKATVILLAPLLRYVSGRCCDDSSHLTNYGDGDFMATLGSGIKKFTLQMRGMLYARKLRNATMLSSTANMGFTGAVDSDSEVDDLILKWGKDPVHPDPKIGRAHV